MGVKKQKPILKIILPWKGLAQGYSTYGGSLRVIGSWVPAIGGRQMSPPNYSVRVMMMMVTIIN